MLATEASIEVWMPVHDAPHDTSNDPRPRAARPLSKSECPMVKHG
jgi:hypothetical protein